MKNFPISLALLAALGSFVPTAVAGRRAPGTHLSPPAAPATKNIVLVHGALVDGSGWQKVYEILTKDGYHVSIVQNPLTSLDDDVAMTKRVLDQQDGPTVLVGHSYGGTVITVAGTDPKVKALVYVAALQPEKGESSADLTSARPPAVPFGMKATSDYFYHLAAETFAGVVGADLPKSQTDFMAAAQVYTAGACFGTKAAAAA